MANDPTLVALLEAENEPKLKSYDKAVEEIIKDPQQISGLTKESVRDNVLILLTTHSHRLAQFFRRLCSAVRQAPKLPATNTIAAETVHLFVDVLPYLHQLLEPAKMLEFLVPALDICFASSQRPTLRELASVLAKAGSLLEYLASDPYGSQILRQWVCTLGTSLLVAPILEIWTERLVKLVGSCKASHDFSQTLQHCGTMRTLKSHLQSLETKHFMEVPEPITGNEKLPLSSMTQLSKEDKKTLFTRVQEPKTEFPNLDDNTKGYLKDFDLPEPESWAALRSVIEILEGDKASKLLLSVTTHFPCELCIQGLESSPQALDTRRLRECIGAAPMVQNLQIEILGKALGVWQILLSVQALRSLQKMSSQGLLNPVAEKLRDLASGVWKTTHTKLTGSEAQRKHLKVPLFSTEYGPGKVILWQVDTGVTRDLQVPEQVITVWEVGSLSKMDKLFESVALLQKSYSPEFIHRCCQRPSVQDKKPFPTRFEDSDSHFSTANGPAERLDVRTVDQGIIEMANKFYSLTEPSFRAILANNLSAEFPFNLSKEEAQVISHFQTASLILGRSGTGKTTCLIFKMVGKYLTSKAIVGEIPVRQVLLTKSSFLADKLRAYARGLINTLQSKSIDAQSPRTCEDLASTIPSEDLREESVSTLGEHSVPLVLTFDVFLRILENTAEDFSEPGAARKAGHWRIRQPVDFLAFKLDYWPRFPQHLTKKLGVSLVFAEIMGVIKGSASSGRSLSPLSRQEYMDRSCRLAPVFVNEDDRAMVYDLFERYEEMKQERQDVDNVDRVVELMSAVRRNPSLKQLLETAFDEVYIDEVQDQRCVDIQFLLEFIKDSRGLHFAGDTAQAISQDSTFRFSDVKAIIYENFAAASAYTNQSQLARTTMFTLSKNYRSHKGILALASLVMAMIWKGFPETVDKLQPEVGNLNGPKPILFLGCDSNILRTSKVGLVNLSDRVADFGAEQVILVRDESMRSKLQGEIGNIALILTILDSKGMEFDDVILWDFFTSSPDPSGVRSLSALTADAQSAFDGERHSGMCSELKHLYVAITRARIQLFLIESSEEAMVSVVRLLTSGPSGSLVDVVRPHEEGFSDMLKMLRPGTSVDPVRWSLRGDEFMQRQDYKYAVSCFQKAKNQRGETIANARMLEEKGRVCRSKNDIQGFTQNIEAAIELFLETKLIGDAAKNLATLTKFEDAAELWLLHNEAAKAAPLFAEAGLYSRAAECHQLLAQHDEAVAMLRQGSHFDQLVSYLDEYSEDLLPSTLRSYSLLFKLLLKQDKVSSEYRSRAIKLLGSPDEQKACFIEYGMDKELAELYSGQKRYKDLFDLYSRNGELEKALNLAITKDLLRSGEDYLEPEILSLVDYVWAGHLETSHLQHSAIPLKLPSGFLTSNVRLRAEQWEASRLAYSLEGVIAGHHVAQMESAMPKMVLCLRILLDPTAIARTTGLPDLPFEIIREVIWFAKRLVVDKDNDTMKILLVLTGLWKYEKGQAGFTVLPWSPLRETLTDVSNVDAPKVAIRWILDRLSSALLVLDARARNLWKVKWPNRCVQFTTLGFCPRKHSCDWLHQPFSTKDCSNMLDDLLGISSFFCDLAVLYYHRSMNVEFQERYMGIKRHWLERLLRELTFLSSAEQHTSTIVEKQVKLFHNERFIAVSSFLEELLYFRLRNEWKKRSDFTSLLEQIQVAKAFRPGVQYRLFGAMSYRLLDDRRYLLQRHLVLSDSLKANLGLWNASLFQHNLNIFLCDLDNIELPALSTLHSLTAVFEYLAAYLILKTCAIACAIPNSWIDLHVGSISRAVHSAEPLQGDDKHIYQYCSIQLAKSFCHILGRLNKALPSKDFFLCSGLDHQPLLLRQRNAELVAILVANLAVALPGPPSGFSMVWAEAKEVFGYDFIKAIHLKSDSANELTEKLPSSFARYNCKDALVVVVEDQKKVNAFSNLVRQPGLSFAPFDQICSRAQTSVDNSAQRHAILAPMDDAHGQYGTAETEAMIKIQRLWRTCSLRIKNRHSYVSVPVCRATARFFNLGAQHPTTVANETQKAIRKLLVSHGVALSLRLDTARVQLSQSQKDAVSCAEKLELSTGLFEAVDDVLHRNRVVETLLEQAKEMMSDERLVGPVKLGELSLLEKTMKEIEGIILEAEQSMLETRKIVDTVSRNCK